MKSIHSLITVPVLLSLAACGAKKTQITPDAVPTPSTTRDAASTTRIRKCEKIELTLTNTSRLSAFFRKVVSSLEGPATLCFAMDGYDKNVSGTLRVEYEDDAGVRSFDIGTDPKNIYGGEIKFSDTKTDLELIFIDDVGFIQVLGSAGKDNVFTGKVRHYDFPSFDQALSDQVMEAQNKCKTGQMTVAQCLGYNFPPTFWWNEPIYLNEKDALMAQVRAILNDANRTKTLGTFTTDLTEVFASYK